MRNFRSLQGRQNVCLTSYIKTNMCRNFTVKVVSIQADNKRQSSMKTKLLFSFSFQGGGRQLLYFPDTLLFRSIVLTFIFWLTGNSLALRINDKSVYSIALKDVIFPPPYHDILKASLIIIKTQRTLIIWVIREFSFTSIH